MWRCSDPRPHPTGTAQRGIHHANTPVSLCVAARNLLSECNSCALQLYAAMFISLSAFTCVRGPSAHAHVHAMLISRQRRVAIAPFSKVTRGSQRGFSTLDFASNPIVEILVWRIYADDAASELVTVEDVEAVVHWPHQATETGRVIAVEATRTDAIGEPL